MPNLSVRTRQAILHLWALKKSSFLYKVCVQMKHMVVGSEVGRSTQPMGRLIGNGLIMKLSGIHPFLFMIHHLLQIVQPHVLGLQIAHWWLRREEGWKSMGAMSHIHSCVHWLRVSYSSSRNVILVNEISCVMLCVHLMWCKCYYYLMVNW